MYGTASIVGQQRIAAESLSEAAGIQIVSVPYNGAGPAVTAALGGHASMVVLNVSELAPHVAAGKLRAIAVTSATRSEVLKDVPTIAESGYPKVDVTNWFGSVVRSATPRPIVERLSAEIGRALQLPEVAHALTKLGLTPAPMGAEAFDAFLRAEMEKNGRIIQKLNLKVN
jgi:tripartite-type tricarboxylate transporter receptor subunit TctC